MIVKPFRALRPKEEYAAKVSSPPYDVVNEKEAREIYDKEPLSFMKVIRPEITFPEGQKFSGCELYERASGLIGEYIDDGIFIQDDKPAYYIYRQMKNGRIQTGLVACFAVNDYLSGNIKQHEQTRRSKEEDRICHIGICNANTGLVYLAYKKGKDLRAVIEKETTSRPLYDFFTKDNVRHIVWKADDPKTVNAITKAAGKLDSLYIADGHHRAASAAAVCNQRRAKNLEYTGDEEFNYFLAVAFPQKELLIMPYYRVIKDLNGLSREEFLEKLSEKFYVSEVPEAFTEKERENGAYQPARKNEIAMYLEGKWYRLNAKEEILKKDPVGILDVSLLQENVLGPILGISDPRTSDRIDFVGGVRGMGELEKRCSEDMELAFGLYPTSMEELMNVADEGLFMPPKSTWFEPKLQSGLFIHKLGE